MFQSSSTNSSESTVRRCIHEILSRHQDKYDLRQDVFAPDFLHGAVRLDEIYISLGENWVENAIFIEVLRDEDDLLQAVSVAYFQDYFLYVEQAVRSEEHDLEAWLERRIHGRKAHVFFHLTDNRSGMRATQNTVHESLGQSRIDICCSPTRLEVLEKKYLQVTRESAFPGFIENGRNLDAVLAQSSTNLMSLVTLCSRLIES